MCAGNDLASGSGVRNFAFAEAPPQLVPTHRPSTLVIAVLVHALVFAALTLVKAKPVAVSSAGSPQGSIDVYVTGPAGGAPAAAPKPPTPKPTLKMEAENAPKDVTPDAGTTAGSAGIVGAGQTGGPVRLGSGGSVTLLRKVQPVYPPIMQSARLSGTVVLDAIIHADGTIGDVTVLQSTNDAFTRSAVEAIKQWKYAPIGYEAILTVTVNFKLT